MNQSARLPEVPEYDVGGATGYDDVVGFRKAFLALRPLENSPHPDFLLFQSLHLMTELGWYVIHTDLVRAGGYLGSSEYEAAAKLVQRAVTMQQQASTNLDHLRGLIGQAAFLKIRAELPGTDSGLDSPGARNLRKAARYLSSQFARALDREGIRPFDIFLRHGFSAQSLQLSEVASGMLNLDDALMDWQQVHQRLVWSRVGGHPHFHQLPSRSGRESEAVVTGMSGRPVNILERFTSKLHFPELWQAAEIAAQNYSVEH